MYMFGSAEAQMLRYETGSGRKMRSLSTRVTSVTKVSLHQVIGCFPRWSKPCARYSAALWFYRHYPQLTNITCIQGGHTQRLPGINETSAWSVSIFHVFYLQIITGRCSVCNTRWKIASCVMFDLAIFAISDNKNTEKEILCGITQFYSVVVL